MLTLNELFVAILDALPAYGNAAVKLRVRPFSGFDETVICKDAAIEVYAEALLCGMDEETGEDVVIVLNRGALDVPEDTDLPFIPDEFVPVPPANNPKAGKPRSEAEWLQRQ